MKDPVAGALERVCALHDVRKHSNTLFHSNRAVIRLARALPLLWCLNMLHHLSLGVADIARAAAFYDAALTPLGNIRV